MNKLSGKIEQKSLTDRIIEKSVELYDFTPDERSDDNVNWMVENGYLSKPNRRKRKY